MFKGRIFNVAFAALVPLALGACGGQPNVSRAAGHCSEQIILSLAPGFDRTDKVIKQLSKGAGVRLEYLRSASPNLHVFKLTAAEKDPRCQNALARLRQDSRVRFAEPDERRTHS